MAEDERSARPAEDRPAARPSRAAERIARELASVLLHSGLPEGTLLSPEAELTKTLKCSRTSLRGALRLLESWGLISVRPGRHGGPVLRHPRAVDLRPGVAALIHSRNASLADLITARKAIDPLIAAEAARRRSHAQVLALRDSIRVADEAIGSREVFSRANARFHSVLAEAAGLSLLGAFLAVLTAIADETVNRVAPNDETRRLRVLRAHERVVDAIDRKDPDGAERAMLTYLVEAEKYWRGYAPHVLDAPLRPLASLVP